MTAAIGLGAGRAGAERPAEASSSGEVPDECGGARAGRVKGPAVAGDLGCEHAAGLPGERLAGGRAPHVPEDHTAVCAGGDQPAAIGREAGAEDLCDMAAQCCSLFSGLEVEKPDGAVLAADRHRAVVRSKGRWPILGEELRGRRPASAASGAKALRIAHHGLALPDGHQATPVTGDHQRGGAGTIDGYGTGPRSARSRVEPHEHRRSSTTNPNTRARITSSPRPSGEYPSPVEAASSAISARDTAAAEIEHHDDGASASHSRPRGAGRRG